MAARRREREDTGLGGLNRPAAFGAGWRGLLRKNAILLAFTAFIMVMPFWAAPLSKSIDIPIVLTMRLVGIYAIVAVGLNLLMGYAGQVSLGQGAFFGIGAYASALLTTKAGFPVWLGIPCAVLVALIFGILLAPVLRLKGHYLAMGTLAMGIVVFVFLREMTWLTGGNDGVRNIPHLSLPFLEVTSTRGEFYYVWVIVIIVLALCSKLVESRVGRAMRALHQSEVAAEAMGVPVSALKKRVFVLSAALGGLAGGLFAHLQRFIDPNQFTIILSISLVTMVVIGGMESVWGSVFGAGLITFLPKLVEALPRWFGDVPDWLEKYSNYEGMVLGLIIMLTMVFMPSGITRGLVDLFSRRRSPFVNPFRRKAVD